MGVYVWAENSKEIASLTRKSVLHLSTRLCLTSIRRLALSSIEPLTPHDRLLLVRIYSPDDWVVPALSALCERAAPLTLLEAREISTEDVVLASTSGGYPRPHASSRHS